MTNYSQPLRFARRKCSSLNEATIAIGMYLHSLRTQEGGIVGTSDAITRCDSSKKNSCIMCPRLSRVTDFTNALGPEMARTHLRPRDSPLPRVTKRARPMTILARPLPRCRAFSFSALEETLRNRDELPPPACVGRRTVASCDALSRRDFPKKSIPGIKCPRVLMHVTH